MATATTAPASATGILTTDERRLDGRDKVSGKMQYAADFAPAGMLWAAFTTSPFPHARIISIDTSEARDVPGVRAIITSADVGPGKRTGRTICDFPVLAYDKVIMIGDRVAAVAAETREAAEEAARLVSVEYEELPAILDPDAAVAADAPIVHPDRATYSFSGKPNPDGTHPNVHGVWRHRHGDGDIDAIFAAAPHVFEHRFRTPRQHAGYIEPKATVVWIDGNGTVHVQTPNKAPFNVQKSLADIAGIPIDKISIEPCGIGGDFGSKGLTTDEYPCYFLAKATGRPVKRVSSYTNELSSHPCKHAATIALQTAVSADGTFLAHRSLLVYDGGAYAAGKPSPHLLPGGTGYATIPYAVKNVALEVRSVYTNTAPGTHVRAPGNSQLFFAWEQHVDLIAAALELGPLAVRRRNMVGDRQQQMSGEYIHHSMGIAVLDRLGDEMAKKPPAHANRAWGFSMGCRHTGGGVTSLELTLQPDGRVEILSGVTDQGAGGHTMAQRVVAATMSIVPERVTFRRGSTLEARKDPGTGSSRVTHIVGRSAQIAAQQLLDRLAEETGMELRDDRFWDAAGRSQSFESVVARVTDGEPWKFVGAFDGSKHSVDHPSDYTFVALGLDVEVDRETGAFKIHDAVFVCDVGAIINPIAHQGQIDGGFVFGLGTAAFEELVLDESGKVTNPSLADYKLPTINDIPPLRTILLDDPGLNGPFGAKMAGELSNIVVASSLANAVANAGRTRLYELPITAERIFGALNANS